MSSDTVPADAEVVIQTKLFAGMIGLLNVVVVIPVVVLLQTIPDELTVVPAVVLSEPYLTVNVTDGVVPITTDTIFVIVIDWFA